MNRRLLWGLAAAWLTWASTGWAHHSFAMYDTAKVVVLKGTVNEFDWTNPHALLWLIDSAGDGGPGDLWTIELPTSPGNLGRMGWTSSIRCTRETSSPSRSIRFATATTAAPSKGRPSRRGKSSWPRPRTTHPATRGAGSPSPSGDGAARRGGSGRRGNDRRSDEIRGADATSRETAGQLERMARAHLCGAAGRVASLARVTRVAADP